jgi:hypothetical protein
MFQAMWQSAGQCPENGIQLRWSFINALVLTEPMQSRMGASFKPLSGKFRANPSVLDYLRMPAREKPRLCRTWVGTILFWGPTRPGFRQLLGGLNGADSANW